VVKAAVDLRFVPHAEFRRVLDAPLAPELRAELFAGLCRLNVLYMVKRAGSGHLGTSFSSLDLVSWIFLEEVKRDQDIFFSSKGHDVPAFYAALLGLGDLPFDKLHALRRLGGLPGHPDIALPRLEANTGSLGMGISKAKGMIRARRELGRPARAFVLTGDGELDEGQIWESLTSAVASRMSELTVIVDHNKIQSDTWVHKVSDLGDLEAKFRAFGWHTARIPGHDFAAIAAALRSLRDVTDKPKVVIADTLKGKGVSFMEAFGPNDKYYGFHAGAPSDEHYAAAVAELTTAITRSFERASLGAPHLETVAHEVPPSSPEPRHKLVEAYGRALVEQAAKNPRLIALDADLVKDTGLSSFAERFPERLIECGIAEQDMVAQAGGLALKGLLPVVHSFSAFLSARPNEQFYTNGTEGTKVVYTATLAGLLPATPGHSHQSVRDISALGAVPNLVMLAPSSEPMVVAALDYALNVTRESTYLRLSSIPCVVPFPVDPRPQLALGCGAVVRQGKDVVIVAYGPVLLSQAFLAAERLATQGIDARVIDLPWLNRVDADWLTRAVAGARLIVSVDDHYVHGGQGQLLLATLAARGWPAGVRALQLGLREIPACGQNEEVLAHHGLDPEGIARAVRAAVT
jgi:transketolase